MHVHYKAMHVGVIWNKICIYKRVAQSCSKFQLNSDLWHCLAGRSAKKKENKRENEAQKVYNMVRKVLQANTYTHSYMCVIFMHILYVFVITVFIHNLHNVHTVTLADMFSAAWSANPTVYTISRWWPLVKGWAESKVLKTSGTNKTRQTIYAKI